MQRVIGKAATRRVLLTARIVENALSDQHHWKELSKAWSLSCLRGEHVASEGEQAYF